MPLQRDLITRFLGEDGSLQNAVRRVGTSTEGLNTKMDRFAKGARTAFVAVGVVSAARMGQELFQTGIEAEAMKRRFDTVFGEAGGGINGQIDELANSLGIAQVRLQGMAADVGKILTSMGLNQEAAAGASVEVLKLTDAWDQFTGGTIGAEEITDKLTRGILGQTRGLIDLGIKFGEADVKARLLATGQDGLTGEARKQAEAMIRLQLILEGSTDALTAYAEGETDAEKAADDLAASLDEAKIAIGEAVVALAPLVEGFAGLVTTVNKVPGGTSAALTALAGFKIGGPLGAIIGGILGFGLAVDNLDEKLNEMVAASSKAIDKNNEFWRSAMNTVGAVKDTAREVTEAAARFRELGDGLDEIPDAVQRLEAELSAIDITTPAERMAELSDSIVSIWGEVPEKIEAVDIQKAIDDALSLVAQAAQFERDMATLIDQGFGGLVESVASNPDKQEAIALMAYFAGNLAAAAEFSTAAGLSVDRSMVAFKRHLANTAIWAEMQALFSQQGYAAWEAFAAGLDAGAAGGAGQRVVDALRRNIIRGGGYGLE